MSRISKSSSSFRARTFASSIAGLSLIGGVMLAGCGTGSGSSSNNNSGSSSGAGSGGVRMTFSNASGTNANTASFQSTNVLATTSSAAITLLNITGTHISGATSRTFLIVLADSGPIQAGKTYSFTSPNVSNVSYTESAGTTAHVWVSTGGSAVVDSVTGKNYKMHLVDATFEAGADNNSGATGSFTINGTVDATTP